MVVTPLRSPNLRRALTAPFALVALASLAPAQVAWTKVPLVDASWASAATYDTVRGRVVLVGLPATALSAFVDTWEWDGAGWLARNPMTRPSAPRKARTPRAGAPGEAFRAEEAILSAAASPQDDRSCTLRASSAGSGLLVFRGEVGSCGGFGEQVAKGGDLSEAKEPVKGPAMSSIVP
jgi:hypothetical protein